MNHPKSAIELAATERAQQISKEGWTPDSSTEENPYYYEHPKGQVKCSCDFPQVWSAWPRECRICFKIIPDPATP